jgi:polysaccharide chain length determinant protein (PEP-CTERM system associated)
LISKTDLQLTIRGPADLEALVADLGKAIRITPQTRSLFTITYANSNPQLAHDVVSTILNIFIESKAGNDRTDLDGARRFLAEQIGGYEGKLREAESKRAEFRTKYVDLLPSDTGTSRLDTARSTARTLQGELQDATAKRDRLQQELATTPPTLVVETDPAVAAGGGGEGGELATAQRRLQTLLANETDENPDVIRQRRLIEQLRKTGGGGGAAAAGHPARNKVQPNAVYAQLKILAVQADSDVASLERQAADATRERDRLEEIARNAPGIQAQFVNLDRDYDVLRKAYEELLARRESMRLSAAADGDADKVKLQIIDPPQVPQIPAGPKRALLMSGVLLTGLAAGVATAGLLGQFDRSFHSEGDLRDFGLPVAGAISMLATLQKRTSLLVQSMSVAVAVLVLVGIYGGLLFTVLNGGLA